jgi:hypothetical protein
MNTEKLYSKIEELSEEVHNTRWKEKKKQGFHAPTECLSRLSGEIRKWCPKCHTDMYPYNELPENIKEYDRVTVRSVLAAIEKVED